MTVKVYPFDYFVRTSIVAPIASFLDGTIEEETEKLLKNPEQKSDAFKKLEKMAPGMCSGKGWTLVKVDEMGMHYTEEKQTGLPDFF